MREERTADYDVVVIGAGIVGVSTALHLLMRGKKVLLLDRGAVGHETSYGNAGIIEASYVLPFGFPSLQHIVQIMFDRDTAARVHYPSLPRYLRWLFDFYRQSQPAPRQLNGRLLRPLVENAVAEHQGLMRNTEAARYLSSAGRVKLHRSAESFRSGAFERRVAQELGVPFAVMDAKVFGEYEPSLNPIYHCAVRWPSSARLTNPAAVTAAYAERFVREGGVFRQEPVRALEELGDGLWQVQAGAGTVKARHVVLCAGPWSTDFCQALGYHFPLQVKRGYHQHFAAQGSAALSHALVDVDVGYVLAPMEQGYRIVTGVEFAALGTPPTPVQIARVLPYARELFPLGRALENTAWTGNRPCFADSLPVIAPAPNHRGLWFNFGHGHSGLTIGPTSGRLLAEMLCGELPFCDPTPYRATRFR